MARKRRIPIVGTQEMETAQLSPELRSLLKRRSDAAARREYAPVLAADRQAFGAANQRYRSEKESIRGATGMAQNSLSQALQGLQGSGLSGRYLKQATSELTARQGDVAGSIPLLLSDAARERGEAIQGARTELISDRADMKQSAASMFNQLLKEQREKASTVLGARGDQDSRSPSDLRKLSNAQIALRDALSAWRSNPEFQEANPLTTIDQWRGLAQQMTKQYDGFDLSDVMEVIRRSLQKRKRQLGQVKRGQRDFEDVSPLVRKMPNNLQPLGIRFNAG